MWWWCVCLVRVSRPQAVALSLLSRCHTSWLPPVCADHPIPAPPTLLLLSLPEPAEPEGEGVDPQAFLSTFTPPPQSLHSPSLLHLQPTARQTSTRPARAISFIIHTTLHCQSGGFARSRHRSVSISISTSPLGLEFATDHRCCASRCHRCPLVASQSHSIRPRAASRPNFTRPFASQGSPAPPHIATSGLCPCNGASSTHTPRTVSSNSLPCLELIIVEKRRLPFLNDYYSSRRHCLARALPACSEGSLAPDVIRDTCYAAHLLLIIPEI